VPDLPEEPLDPASQSLADALRSSFQVLKGIMVLVVIFFLFSGMLMVDQNEVVVVSRFGRLQGEPRGPGLHFGFPYPIDEKVKVSTSPQILEIEDFWLTLSDAEKARPLDQLGARSGGLNPASDGALISGDGGIMHLKLVVQFRVKSAAQYVQNVKDGPDLIRAVVKEAAVARAARARAETIWKTPGLIVGSPTDHGLGTIWGRAQARLDELETGIVIEHINATSHYPLQVKTEFEEISVAENQLRNSVQGAQKEREDKLKSAAGAAWEAIYAEIQKLDQLQDEPERRAEVFARINELLDTATGEAARRISLAQANKDRIVAEARAAAARFNAVLDAYRKNPELVKARMRQDMIADIFSEKSVSRWFLPEGHRFILLNKNPEEIREAERDRIRQRAESANKR